MIPEETIKELQNALKRERAEKKIYKTQIEQYKRDLDHRDRIIERLRAALSTRHKTPTTRSPSNDIALFGNSAAFDVGFDREPSSRTSVELIDEDAAVNYHREQRSSQDSIIPHRSSPEYIQSQSALSDVTTDILSSFLPATPRSRRNQNSQILATVNTPRRPRASGGDDDVYPGYVEHPSPSLRAYNGKSIAQDESLDLQQVQAIAFANNLKMSRPFETLPAATNTQPSEENLPKVCKDMLEQDEENRYVQNDEDDRAEGYAPTVSTCDTQERSTVLNKLALNSNNRSPIHDHMATNIEEKEMTDENRIPYNVNNQEISPQHEFAYVDVVRNKYERTKMHGRTCTCCSEFYRAVGTLPDVEEPNRLQHVSERIKKNSRHRELYKRPRTPPGYWDVEFPSSQELKRLKQIGAQANNSSWEHQS